MIRTELPDGRKVAFAVETDYPRDGRIVVRIGDQSVGAWTLSVRVPHWADGAAAVTAERRTVRRRAGRIHPAHPGLPGR